jgi:hypothetical protein
MTRGFKIAQASLSHRIAALVAKGRQLQARFYDDLDAFGHQRMLENGQLIAPRGFERPGTGAGLSHHPPQVFGLGAPVRARSRRGQPVHWLPV